jgi:hypothetical protein
MGRAAQHNYPGNPTRTNGIESDSGELGKASVTPESSL